jgi:hypothetical protein
MWCACERAVEAVVKNRHENGWLLESEWALESERGCLLRGDPGWLAAHQQLRNLHTTKASTYGTRQDSLANYVETSEAVGEPDEFTPALRIHEKMVRALNLIRDGRADECDEWMDIAALALGAEAPDDLRPELRPLVRQRRDRQGRHPRLGGRRQRRLPSHLEDPEARPRVRPARQVRPAWREVLQITANGPVEGAAAYHTQNSGRAAIVVYAGIDDAYGVSLSVAATHEIFERLADGPTSMINQGWPVDNFTVSDGQFATRTWSRSRSGQLLINEVCDPVEAFHYVLKSATGKQVWISDWVTQNYFNDQATMPAGVPQFDFLGLVQSPLEVLPGGYQALYVIDLPVFAPGRVGPRSTPAGSR